MDFGIVSIHCKECFHQSNGLCGYSVTLHWFFETFPTFKGSVHHAIYSHRVYFMPFYAMFLTIIVSLGLWWCRGDRKPKWNLIHYNSARYEVSLEPVFELIYLYMSLIIKCLWFQWYVRPSICPRLVVASGSSVHK